MTPDPGTVLWIAGGLGSVLMVVCLWAWNHTHARIDKAWDAIDEKASNAELIRQRDTVVAVFDRLGKMEVAVARIESTLASIDGRMK